MDEKHIRNLLKKIQNNYYFYDKNGNKVLVKKIVSKSVSTANSKNSKLSSKLFGDIVNLRKLKIKFPSQTRVFKYESSIASYSWVNNTYKYKVQINNRMYYFNKLQSTKKVTLYSLDHIKSRLSNKSTNKTTNNMNFRKDNKRHMFKFNSRTKMKVSAPLY